MYGLNLNPSEPPALPGSSTDATVVSVIGGENLASPGSGLASWGRRLAAYAVDFAVVMTLAMILAASGHPIPAGNLFSALLFTGYMLAAQVTTRFTAGKYIMGIQVVRDYDPSTPPSIGRMFIRETARLIVGIGIFFRLGDARRQGWHDLLADTIVVVRPVQRAIRLALIAAVLVGFVSALTVGTRVNVQKQAKAAELRRLFTAENLEMQKLQLEIDRLRSARGTLSEMQQNQRKVEPLLDTFDNTVRHLEELTQSLAEHTPADKARTLLAMRHIYSTFLDVISVERQQSELILSFPPNAPLKKVQADLQPLAAQLAQLHGTLRRQQQAMQSTLRASGR
jgi:uncharacterized RDD family membrane protein YckC